MSQQRYQVINDKIREKFRRLPERDGEARVQLAWAGWMFGAEAMPCGLARLAEAGMSFVELGGAHHGPDTGPNAAAIDAMLNESGIACSGVACLMNEDYDLSSANPARRQAAIDYVRREIAFAQRIGAAYVSLTPSSGGTGGQRSAARAAQALRVLGDEFVQAGIACAVAPSRPFDEGVAHTLAETQAFLREVDHPGIRALSADTFDMQSAEKHVAQAVIGGAPALINLHLSDRHRGALGEASFDVDILIMGLYIMGYQHGRRFVTFNPIGPSARPFAMSERLPDAARMDRLVHDTARYFRQREEIVLAQEKQGHA